MKVYCSNCIYRGSPDQHRHARNGNTWSLLVKPFCATSLEEISVEGTWDTSPYIERTYRYCHRVNTNNDCANYHECVEECVEKKPWWKFWRK